MDDKLLASLNEIMQKQIPALEEGMRQRRELLANAHGQHMEVYDLFNISQDEGRRIELYHNLGRLFYNAVGRLLEGTTQAVIKYTKGGESIRIENTISNAPKTFSIDAFVQQDNKAHEIKWRDATTDGDHIRKENHKVQCIVERQMIPVRIMYYMPESDKAAQIQNKVIAAYRQQGEAYVGKDAWNYIKDYTGVDLYTYLYEKTRELEN